MYPRDFSIIHSFTFRRLVNAGKSLLSYLWSTITRHNHYWGLPIFLSIEPTSVCNLRCPECPSGSGEITRPNGFIPLESFQSLIDQAEKDIPILILYFQGEPFLHPDIYEMISYAKKKRMYVITSTNGHYFSEEEQVRKLIESGINSLIVSLDGTTQGTYSLYRKGGNLERVIGGIKNIITTRREMKKKLPRVHLQFLVMRHNEWQIDAAKKLTNELGADGIIFKTMRIEHPDNKDFLPTIRQYQRYESYNDHLKLKGTVPNKCFRLWTGSVITWDGKIVPCCYDKNADYVFGNIDEKMSFRDFLISKSANEFRQRVLDSRSSIPLCVDCPEGRIKINNIINS